MDYETLYNQLLDDDFDIAANCFDLMMTLRNAWNKKDFEPFQGAATHQYLVRLRKEYPAVYAISIIDFPDFEPYVEAGVDAEGFTFLQPLPYGKFAERLYQTQIGRGS